MGTEAAGLIEERGQIVGLRATDGDGEFEVRSNLVVVASGRGFRPEHVEIYFRT